MSNCDRVMTINKIVFTEIFSFLPCHPKTWPQDRNFISLIVCLVLAEPMVYLDFLQVLGFGSQTPPKAGILTQIWIKFQLFGLQCPDQLEEKYLCLVKVIAQDQTYNWEKKMAKSVNKFQSYDTLKICNFLKFPVYCPFHP